MENVSYSKEIINFNKFLGNFQNKGAGVESLVKWSSVDLLHNNHDLTIIDKENRFQKLNSLEIGDLIVSNGKTAPLILSKSPFHIHLYSKILILSFKKNSNAQKSYQNKLIKIVSCLLLRVFSKSLSLQV